jgi:hypothetical protein
MIRSTVQINAFFFKPKYSMLQNVLKQTQLVSTENKFLLFISINVCFNNSKVRSLETFKTKQANVNKSFQNRLSLAWSFVHCVNVDSLFPQFKGFNKELVSLPKLSFNYQF